MNTVPGLAVQRVLFVVPYFFTALTCVTTLVVDMNDGGTRTLRFAGWVNSSALALYLMGWLGPHYLKLGCGFFNCAVVAVLWASFHWWSAAALLCVYCIPAFIFVAQAILVPSISEVIPRVYLGNRSAAFSIELLDRFGISHVLDMTKSSRRHPRKAIVKKVYVNDFLGSHGSLNKALHECLAFMAQALEQPDSVVLIHCTAGQSRSAAFLLYYLMETKGMGLQETYAFLRRRRPVVDISSDHMSPLVAKDPAQPRRGIKSKPS